MATDLVGAADAPDDPDGTPRLKAIALGEPRVVAASPGGTLRQVLVSGLTEDGRDLTRFSYDRGDRAFVLPHCPTRGTVMLARQFRVPVALRSDDARNGITLEAPGGLLEGRPPELAAVDEAREELGLRVDALRLVCSVLTSPQLSGEVSHLFVGTYEDPAPRRSERDGGELSSGNRVPSTLEGLDEGEVVEPVEFTVAEAMDAFACGVISDARTGLLLLDLIRSLRLESTSGKVDMP